VEIAAEVDLIGLCDAGSISPPPATTKEAKTAPTVKTFGERFGSLSLYANATFLDAEFVSGPLEGRTPRFAPDYLVRGGVIYRLRDRCKIALLGTFAGESFADDANTQERFIPAYTVWDLTAEVKIYKEISLNAGINNLFDEAYYARIANTGIDPAAGRNFYGGFSVKF
jgi:Fe(3+) dicitrate transport protein